MMARPGHAAGFTGRIMVGPDPRQGITVRRGGDALFIWGGSVVAWEGEE